MNLATEPAGNWARGLKFGCGWHGVLSVETTLLCVHSGGGPPRVPGPRDEAVLMEICCAGARQGGLSASARWRQCELFTDHFRLIAH